MRAFKKDTHDVGKTFIYFLIPSFIMTVTCIGKITFLIQKNAHILTGQRTSSMENLIVSPHHFNEEK